MFVIYLLFISPLCGVAQTPDWGMIYLIILSRRRFRHSIGAFYVYSRNAFYMNNLHACIMNFVYLVTNVMVIEYFRSMITPCYIIPVLLMFASTFKRTHWLVPGYCLGQIPCLERPLWWQPRKLSNGDSSLAKIGVDLVSCSRGKWSPIDTDDSQTASAIDH